MISVALCGAGGTGKGTIITELCENKEWLFTPLRSPIEQIGRRLVPAAAGYDNMSQEEKKRMQYCIVSAQMALEDHARTLQENFIAERSVIDYLPYMMKFCTMDEYCGYSSFITEYLRQNPYDVLVYVPIEFEPSSKDLKLNSWKERNAAARQRTATFLEDIIDDLQDQIPSMKIIRAVGTPAERAKLVTEACQDIARACI